MIDDRLLRRHFLIMPKQRIIYVSVPKNASSTLKVTFARRELDDPDFLPEKMHVRKLYPFKSPQKFGIDVTAIPDDWTTVAFVKNPYVRLLSAYLDKFAPGRNVNNSDKLRAEANLPPTGDVSFSEFVRSVCEVRPEDMNDHWRPQSDILHVSVVNYDILGKMEDFSGSLERLAKVADIRPWLKESSKRSGAKGLVGEYYNEELRALVHDKYRADFEAFGYDERLPL